VIKKEAEKTALQPSWVRSARREWDPVAGQRTLNMRIITLALAKLNITVINPGICKLCDGRTILISAHIRNIDYYRGREVLFPAVTTDISVRLKVKDCCGFMVRCKLKYRNNYTLHVSLLA
jgi:hypothetical protein